MQTFSFEGEVFQLLRLVDGAVISIFNTNENSLLLRILPLDELMTQYSVFLHAAG